MKAAYPWLTLTFALFVTSCGEKEQDSAPASIPEDPVVTAPMVPDIPGVPELPEIAALTAAERAEMLGFVGHLAPETDLVMSIYDGRGLVKSGRSLKSWAFLRELSEEEFSMDPEEEAAEPLGQAGAFLGDEFFLAMGDGSAEQFEIWNEFNARMGYYQSRMMTTAAAEGLVAGDVEDGLDEVGEEAWMKEMAKDIGKYMPWVEGVQMPGLLGGLKIVDAEARGMAEEQLRSIMMFFGEEVAPAEFEKGGVTFSGVMFEGSSFVEEMEADREEMDELMGEANTDKVIEAISEKTLMITVGVKDDYLLLYLGEDEKGCPVADSLEASLAASNELAFIDEFKGQPVHGFIYSGKDVSALAKSSGLKDLAEGVRDGMMAAEGIGDTRELVALLDLVGEKEAALLDQMETSSLGGVIRIDGGLVFEIFGGAVGTLDYETTHKLGALGEGENVLLFANWVTDEEYGDKAADLIQLLVETTYAGAEHLAGLEIDSEEMQQFKGFFGMFDQMMKEDAVKLWEGLGTMAEGLGNESALVVDLNAAFPPMPGVPSEMIENGRFIRASYLSPVEDRPKLKESWVTIDASIRSMLKSLGEAGLGEMNMLDPTSSSKDDIVTWYFDALAFSDDMKPSITVNDDWFVASTSKTQALDLVANAAQPASTVRQGSWMSLDLDVLRAYLEETLKMVDQEGEALFEGKEEELEEFREMLPTVLKGLAAMEDVKAITVHDRMERGTRRATLKFHGN